MIKRIVMIVAVALLSTARAADAPVIPDSIRAKIFKIQLDQSRLMSEYQQIQSRVVAIQKEYTDANAALQAAQEEAYKAAKVNKKDWSMDMKDVVLFALPKPAPAPEKKP